MLIKEFSSYKDGGTISVKCRIGGPIWKFYFDILNKSIMMGDEVDICIDGRFGKCPLIWIGYPDSDGSILIEDNDVIRHIISKIEEHKRIENHRMDCFLNYDKNLRDWKIKNIINN
jgi:hypothetical protein